MVETMPPANSFNLTRLIGGKLRALYDEEAQPCSSQIADLLETVASHLKQARQRRVDRAGGVGAHLVVKQGVAPMPMR